MKRLLLASVLLITLAALPASAAASYMITVHINSPSYVGFATAVVSGQVYPAPGPNTAVYIRVFNPANVLVTALEESVNGTTGLYSGSFVTGGSSSWVEGNYIVNVTWGAYGSPAFGVGTFSWSSTATTSTTSTSTTTTTSATASSASTSATSSTNSTSSQSSVSSSTTSTSSSSGGIPEFPFQALAVMSSLAIVVGAYVLLTRRRFRGKLPGLD